jgi:hypothetical protein
MAKLKYIPPITVQILLKQEQFFDKKWIMTFKGEKKIIEGRILKFHTKTVEDVISALNMNEIKSLMLNFNSND